MAILNTLPLKTGVITNLYTSAHPVMQEGIVIETIHAYRDASPEPSTPTSVRFFAKDIAMGALYTGQRLYGDGTLLSECETLWELEDLEIFEIVNPEDYMSVNDFNEFHPWDWDEAKVEQDDNDQYRWRLHVTLKHSETRGRRVLIKTTEFTHTTAWITSPSQRAAEGRLRELFKSEFFAKFQGCKLFMKNPRRFNQE